MVVAPVLIDLSIIVTFLVALALCLLSKQIVEALFKVADSALGWIPWLGSKVQGDLHRIEQRLTNYLGSAADTLSARIGAAWHGLARIVEDAGNSLVGAWEMIYALTHLVGALASWKGVTALYNSLVGRDRATISQVREHAKALNANAKAIRQAKTQADTATARAQAIPADVVLPRDIAGLRGRVRAAEDEIASLWERVKGLGVGAVGGAALGALAFALSKLGVSWARCNNVGRVGKNLCGMDQSLLEALLADSLLVLGTLSLAEFAREMVGVTDTAVRPIQRFWRAD